MLKDASVSKMHLEDKGARKKRLEKYSRHGTDDADVPHVIFDRCCFKVSTRVLDFCLQI